MYVQSCCLAGPEPVILLHRISETNDCARKRSQSYRITQKPELKQSSPYFLAKEERGSEWMLIKCGRLRSIAMSCEDYKGGMGSRRHSRLSRQLMPRRLYSLESMLNADFSPQTLVSRYHSRRLMPSGCHPTPLTTSIPLH